MIGYAWAANCAKIDRIIMLQLFETVGGHHLASFEKTIAAPLEVLPGEAYIEQTADGFQDAHTFRNYLSSNTVTLNYCNLVLFQGMPLIQSQ